MPEESLQIEIAGMVRQLAKVMADIELLNTVKAELEGYFLRLAAKDLADTKLRTVAYADPDGSRVTATMAKSLKLVYPTYLKQIFGEAYRDVVTEEVKHKISAPASRMLVGLWSGEYLRMTVAEAIVQIVPDPELQRLLGKKVKGINYATDKKNLMTIGGFDEQTAESYAYLVAEAAVWTNFLRLLQVQGVGEDAIQRYLDWIDGAVVVEETPKISFQRAEEGDEE